MQVIPRSKATSPLIQYVLHNTNKSLRAVKHTCALVAYFQVRQNANVKTKTVLTLNV